MMMTYVLETSVLNVPNFTSATKLATGARQRNVIATSASTAIEILSFSSRYTAVLEKKIIDKSYCNIPKKY